MTTTEAGDDRALVGRMAGGDPVALRLFYDRHSSVVYGLCVRILGDAHDAEEVLIDVFYEFWRRAESFDPSRGTVLGMLMTLARSRAIDRRRQSRRGLPPLRLQDSDATVRPQDRPDASLALVQDRERIRRAMRALVPEQRRSIEAAYYDGMTHSEIAIALNKPLGTVKTYIRQGLMRLREALSGARQGTM